MLSSLAGKDLPATTIAEATLTHGQPLAADVTAAAVVLRSALLLVAVWEDALALARTGRLEETAAAMTPAGFKWRPGGFAPDTLAAAVHFLSEQGDFAGGVPDAALSVDNVPFTRDSWPGCLDPSLSAATVR